MDKEKEKQYMMTAIMKEFNWRPPMSLERICEGLVHQGYGNVKQAVKEFAESKVKPLIDELVELMFDDNRGKCMVEQCHKSDSTPCGADICVEENKRLWKGKVDKLIEKVYGGKNEEN